MSNQYWPHGSAEATGAGGHEYRDHEHGKLAAKEAHNALTAAGFKKTTHENIKVASAKMGRSTAYTGGGKKLITNYEHPDGRKATLKQRYMKHKDAHIGIYHDRSSQPPSSQHSELPTNHIQEELAREILREKYDEQHTIHSSQDSDEE